MPYDVDLLRVSSLQLKTHFLGEEYFSSFFNISADEVGNRQVPLLLYQSDDHAVFYHDQSRWHSSASLWKNIITAKPNASEESMCHARFLCQFEPPGESAISEDWCANLFLTSNQWSYSAGNPNHHAQSLVGLRLRIPANTSNWISEFVVKTVPIYDTGAGTLNYWQLQAGSNFYVTEEVCETLPVSLSDLHLWDIQIFYSKSSSVRSVRFVVVCDGQVISTFDTILKDSCFEFDKGANFKIGFYSCNTGEDPSPNMIHLYTVELS